MDPQQESPEAQKARLESQAEQAKQNYQEKAKVSEKKAEQKILGLSIENAVKAGMLEVLDLAPFIFGYSLADVVVAAEAASDIVYSIKNKDINAGIRGVGKLAIAAVPGVPVSGAAPYLNEWLPNKEKQKAAQQEQNIKNTPTQNG